MKSSGCLSRIKFNPPCAAYRFPRCTFYHGRWIRHGDWYPDRKARLWQRDQANWGDKRLHESLVVNGDDRRFEK